MFTLTFANIKGAVVSGLIAALLAGASYIIGLGDVFKISAHDLINVIAIAALTSIVSVVKSLLTTDSGSFVGAVQVK